MRVHVSFPVKNLEDSIRFYSRLFDSDPSKRKPDYANFRLNQPPIHLAMVESQKAANGATNDASVQHFGIELPDMETLHDWRTRTTDQDMNAFEEAGAQCCYAEAEKIWLTDPDGHRWEIWVRTGEYDALKQPKSECCA